VGWAAVSPELAEAFGRRIGDTLTVTIGSRRVPLEIGALVDFRRVTPLASARLVVMDLSQAQHLFAAPGEIGQIDVRARPGADRRALAARLAATVGPAADVLTPEQRARRAEGLLAAFRLNLTALSLISLFVGLFLVYSATQAALVRRRAEFGLLRALGATRGQVLGLILGEVALLGVLGTALGLPLGYWAARANVGVVSQTLTNLYLLSAIERLVIPPSLYALAVAIGAGGAVLGALWPALDISRRDATTLLAPFTLHERFGTAAAPLALAGVAVLAGAGGWYAAAGRDVRPAGFVLAVALLLGLPLLTPFVVRGITRRARVTAFGLRYALRGLGGRLQTAAFAVAALAIAVAMLAGITLMIASFRATLVVWADATLQADVYITTPSFRLRGSGATLDSGVVAGIAALPGVRAMDRLRGFLGYSGERRVAVAGVTMDLPGGGRRFPLLSGDETAARMAAAQRGAVLVSEPLARKAGLRPGDSLPLATPAGERRFPIAAVYYDYSSESGTVMMDLGTFAAVFGPGPPASAALYLEPGTDADRTVDLIRARFPDRALLLRSNRSLRAEVFRVFEQTFAITRILQGLALLIAVSGITLTLLILARERLPELALYRALGATTGQVFRLFVAEGLGIGALGLALGLAAGVALAGILVFVINRAYFGWTIQAAFPLGTLAGQAASVLCAAFLASVYPAVRASRTTAAELAREDV
jgi:putative ABC transport system permease protein